MEDYRIHGTNRPYGVGRRVSHGCIRLYPEDIAALFPLVEKGTPVTIIDTNYKLGWKDDELWLEVTPTQQQADEIADYQDPPPIDIPGIQQIIVKMAGNETAIDWQAVDEAINERNGVSVIIARRTSG
jgi:L,D-transpeptidase ErfK/SrfK